MIGGSQPPALDQCLLHQLRGTCTSVNGRKSPFRTNKNGDPKVAAGCMHGQCRAAAVPGSPVELRDNKGYGNHCDGSSNNIELHLAEP